MRGQPRPDLKFELKAFMALAETQAAIEQMGPLATLIGCQLHNATPGTLGFFDGAVDEL
jgi:hypothetical protein